MPSGWNTPLPGVPRTPDGKPNMSAPAPRTADGRPDLSGMWGWETRANCGARCNDFQLSREFINIAASLKGGLPYQPGVGDLVKKRMAAQDRDPNVHCMPRDFENLDGPFPMIRIPLGTATQQRNGKETCWSCRPSVSKTICGWTRTETL